ncbi:serine/threonine protein kinase [Nostoc sp. FACHB-973]|nr:serine/threonine protein kinase [Nostoc sp. FACHB-973]
MSLCINLQCSKAQNRDDELFCLNCGSELLLRGRYRVMHQLGSGGFGLTFEVNEVRINTPKVLKVLINNQQKAVELFQQEAEVLSQLDNPGIPKVERDGYFVYFPRNSQNPVHCLVMEKIVGMDLEKYMVNCGLRPIGQDLAIQWLRELVTILDSVHSQNFFHRDIKPPNIMLRATGELTLIDFGTARQVTATIVNQQGGVTMISSAGYTPIEQINSQAVPQSDFFALGRTFVYLLTGKYPLDSAIYDTQNDELVWRSHAPHISPLLADLLDEMMAHKPKQRPANTQVILQRLAEIEVVLNPPKVVRRTNPPGVAPTQPVNTPQPKVGTPAPTHPKPIDWSFWGKWVLVNTVGGVVGFGVGLPVGDAVWRANVVAGFVLLGILCGGLLAIMQWLMLRRLVSCKWWVLATVVGITIGFLMAGIVAGAVAGAVGGTSVGMIQWLVLRRSLPRTAWWVLANSVGAAIPIILVVPLSQALGSPSPNRLEFFLVLAVYFAIFGAITGGALVWLMRKQPAVKL